MTEKLYRPCVGICLLNEQGLIFAGERINTPGAWQMPQGGIDADEDVLVAARRELREEIGTDKIDIIGTHPEKLRYDSPASLLPKLHKDWGRAYQGQEQQWVYGRFTGVDSDIVLDGDDHPEFARWQWCTPETLMALIVPFKRDVYERVLSHLEHGL